MEINSNLESYIKCYDNVFPENILSNFYKICKKNINFSKGKVINGDKDELDEKTRKTLIWYIENVGVKSLTETHWANFLIYTFNETLKKYNKEINIPNLNVSDLQVLKYEEGVFFKFHVDVGIYTPRNLSFIFLVNAEYEGEKLALNVYNDNKDLIIKKQRDRMII